MMWHEIVEYISSTVYRCHVCLSSNSTSAGVPHTFAAAGRAGYSAAGAVRALPAAGCGPPGDLAAVRAGAGGPGVVHAGVRQSRNRAAADRTGGSGVGRAGNGPGGAIGTEVA